MFSLFISTLQLQKLHHAAALARLPRTHPTGISVQIYALFSNKPQSYRLFHIIRMLSGKQIMPAHFASPTLSAQILRIGSGAAERNLLCNHAENRSTQRLRNSPGTESPPYRPGCPEDTDFGNFVTSAEPFQKPRRREVTACGGTFLGLATSLPGFCTRIGSGLRRKHHSTLSAPAFLGLYTLEAGIQIRKDQCALLPAH